MGFFPLTFGKLLDRTGVVLILEKFVPSQFERVRVGRTGAGPVRRGGRTLFCSTTPIDTIGRRLGVNVHRVDGLVTSSGHGGQTTQLVRRKIQRMHRLLLLAGVARRGRRARGKAEPGGGKSGRGGFSGRGFGRRRGRDDGGRPAMRVHRLGTSSGRTLGGRRRLGLGLGLRLRLRLRLASGRGIRRRRRRRCRRGRWSWRWRGRNARVRVRDGFVAGGKTGRSRSRSSSRSSSWIQSRIRSWMSSRIRSRSRSSRRRSSSSSSSSSRGRR